MRRTLVNWLVHAVGLVAAVVHPVVELGFAQGRDQRAFRQAGRAAGHTEAAPDAAVALADFGELEKR